MIGGLDCLASLENIAKPEDVFKVIGCPISENAALNKLALCRKER